MEWKGCQHHEESQGEELTSYYPLTSARAVVGNIGLRVLNRHRRRGVAYQLQ